MISALGRPISWCARRLARLLPGRTARAAVRLAWRRFTALETKYDRRIFVSLLISAAWIAASVFAG